MISKLVVWGEDRARALARMRRALDEYQVRGIETNLPFHRAACATRRSRPAITIPDSSAATRRSSRRTPARKELAAAMIAAVLDAGEHAGHDSVSSRASATTEISAWRRQLR